MKENILNKIRNGEFIDGDMLYVGKNDIPEDLSSGFCAVFLNKLIENSRLDEFGLDFHFSEEEDDLKINELKSKTIQATMNELYGEDFKYTEHIEHELRRFHSVFLKSPYNTSGGCQFSQETGEILYKDFIAASRTLWYAYMNISMKKVKSFDDRLSSKYMTHFYPTKSLIQTNQIRDYTDMASINAFKFINKFLKNIIYILESNVLRVCGEDDDLYVCVQENNLLIDQYTLDHDKLSEFILNKENNIEGKYLFNYCISGIYIHICNNHVYMCSDLEQRISENDFTLQKLHKTSCSLTHTEKEIFDKISKWFLSFEDLFQAFEV
jgi:hypothetical protein